MPASMIACGAFRKRTSDLLEYLWLASPKSTIILSTLVVNAEQRATQVLRVNDQIQALAGQKSASQNKGCVCGHVY